MRIMELDIRLKPENLSDTINFPSLCPFYCRMREEKEKVFPFFHLCCCCLGFSPSSYCYYGIVSANKRLLLSHALTLQLKTINLSFAYFHYSLLLSTFAYIFYTLMLKKMPCQNTVYDGNYCIQ